MAVTGAGKTMARNPQQVADSQCPQRLREHGPEPRMAVIPAEAIAVLAGCPIPLVLADVVWPYDLARSPLLYANPAMLDLLSGIDVSKEADYPAGLQLGSLFQIIAPASGCAEEAGSCPVRLIGGTPPAGKQIGGMLVVVAGKDQLGRAAPRFGAFPAEDASPLERRLVETVLEAAALALSQAAEVVIARSTLNTVLSSLTDAFMSVDHAWRFTRVNRMAAQACGMAPEDMIGRSFWELFPEAIGSPLQAAARRAEIEQVSVQAEAFHPRFGRWSEYHVYPSPDGLGIIETDITPRKQQEARQRLMADLNEAIRLLADPTEMMEVALVLAGRHYGASRTVFAEIEPTTLDVIAYRQYVDGAPEFPMDIRLADFGQPALEHLQRGHTLVVEDVLTDERTADGMCAFKRTE